MKIRRNSLVRDDGRSRWRLVAHVIGAVALLATIVGTTPGNAAADGPVIGGLTPVVYTEGGDPVQVAPGITITGGSFADGYVEFAVASSTAEDRLFLPEGSTPDTTDGAVTMIGEAVHLGLGDGEHKQIGTIDAVNDGREGRPLRVNFSAALPNASFNEVDGDGHPVGWTVNEERLVLGTDVVTKTQGRALGASAGGIGAYTINGPDYSFVSDRDYRPGGQEDGWGWEGVQRDLDPNRAQRPFQAEVVDDALRLFSEDNWCVSATTSAYCSVFGPDAWSSPFDARANDDLAFDWSAANGKDDYEVYGFLVDEDGVHTELMYGRGYRQGWTTSTGKIPADGTYRFRFVSGTYDSTGGLQVGASLYIDDVRVLSSDATAAVAQSVARLVHYEHTGDNPPAEIKIGVTASTDDGTTDPVEIPTEVTLVDDPPTVDPIADITYTNAEEAESFATATGTVTASDPEGDPITFSVDGGLAGSYDVAGETYTHARTTALGTLYLDAADGTYAFVPDADAIDALTAPDEVEVTITASAAGLTDSTTLTISVGIAASAPGAPTGLDTILGDGWVDLGWIAPSWTGGDAVSDHVVEVSTDGGATWTATVTGSGATGFRVEGLTPGVETMFRVSAVNGNGTGAPSVVVTTTPATVPGAPTITSITAGNHALTVTFAAPADDGAAAITTYEHSVDGGVTWTRRSVDSTASPLVVRPLDNGTTYPVRLRAVNAAGAGAASNEVAATPVAAPVLRDDPDEPPAPTGSGVLLVDGVERPVTRSTPSPLTGDYDTPAGTLRFSDGSFAVDLLGLDEDGEPLQLDAEGRLVIVAGAYAAVSGEGFRPGSTVDVWLMSTPILLGEVTVRADGTFSARLPIPDGVAPGPHTIQLNGVAADGSVRTLSVGVVVRTADAAGGAPGTVEHPDGESPEAPAPASLAFTGAQAATVSTVGAILLLAGLALGGGSRRRRRTA